MDHSRYLKFKTGALLLAIFSLTACSSSHVDDPNAPPPETAGDVAAAPDAKTDAVPVGEDPSLAQQPAPGALDAAGATPPADVPPGGDPAAIAASDAPPPGGDPSSAASDPSAAAPPPDAVASNPVVDPAPASIPADMTPPVGDLPATPVADVTPSVPDTSVGGVHYKVKRGDTLMKIAFEQYGDLYRWKEIYEANRSHIKDPSNVPPGTSLTLNGSGMVSIDRNGEQYLIKHGDTLGVISNDVYGTTHKWKKLWENNRQLIKDPNKIYAGFYLYYHPEARMTQDQTAPKGGTAANLPFKNQVHETAKTAANTVVKAATTVVAPAARAPASTK